MAIKIWKCPICNDEKISHMNIVMKICHICQVEMIPRIEGLKKEDGDCGKE